MAASLNRSGYVAPGAIGIAAGGAAQDLGATVDEDPVGVVAAVVVTTTIGFHGHDLAVTAIVRVAPDDDFAGPPALECVEFRPLCEKTVLAVHRSPDLAAYDAADNGSDDGARRATAATTGSRADQPAGNSAYGQSRIRFLAAPVGSAARDEERNGDACRHEPSAHL